MLYQMQSSVISKNQPEDYHRCHSLSLPECLHPSGQSPLCLPIAATLYAVLDLYDHSTSSDMQTVTQLIKLN